MPSGQDAANGAGHRCLVAACSRFIAGQDGVSGAEPMPDREIQSGYSTLLKVGRMTARGRLLYGLSGQI